MEDPKNRITSTIEFGALPKKPSDYFATKIYANKKPVSTVTGTYCGYIEFDGKRLWDGRDIQPFPMKWEKDQLLDSDWSHRKDLQLLKENNLNDGQLVKERM